MLPSRTYHYTLKKGLTGSDVWALQINFNSLITPVITEDGVFGDATVARTKTVQRYLGLTVDGVAGPVTQRTLGLVLSAPTTDKFNLPEGLVRGVVEGESGWMVGAVNWTVAGGIDCGWVQRRVYTGSPDSLYRAAFSGRTQFNLLGDNLRTLKDDFYGRPGAQTHQRAWELAVLSHNWPYGARTLANGGHLSTSYTTWVDAASGGRVTTPAQWAEFYISGKAAYVTKWTT